jgi:hypothetical protein
LENNFIEFSQPASERLRALYSDFSKLAILNKYAFDTNVSYWRRVILDCSQQGYLGSSDYATVINIDTIAEKFQRAVIGKPLALDTVLVRNLMCKLMRQSTHICICIYIDMIGKHGERRRTDTTARLYKTI